MSKLRELARAAGGASVLFKMCSYLCNSGWRLEIANSCSASVV